MSEPRLTADAWLSARLGKLAFHLVGQLGQGLPADIAARLKGEELFVDAKIATDDIPSIRALLQHSFLLTDTKLRFSCRRDVIPTCDLSAVGFAIPGMIEVVGAIAEESFVFDRFHCDPAIPHGVAGAIKRDWARNYFSGNRGEWMVVALEESNPVGFLQLLHSSADELIIDLIAVDGRHRGKGLARAMISFASRECGVSGPVIVGTQVTNIPSVRLYEGLGFRLDATQYVFHHHGRSLC
jgi:GNAT superfamily N-acetyltransferase